MAKGDDKRVQNAIDTQGSIAQTNQNNLWNRNQMGFNYMWPNYQNAVNRNLPTYDSVMGNYQTFLGGGMPGYGGGQQQQQGKQGYSFNGKPTEQDLNQFFTSRGVGTQETPYWLGKWDELTARGQEIGNPNYAMDRLNASEALGGGGGGQQNGAISGWQNFAQTGGYSPEDLANIRQRAQHMVQSVYQQGQDELGRQRRLAGGYMPNFAPAQAKMARDQAQSLTDANVNSNAQIAQMVQQGKLSGLQGLTGAQLGALAGMTNMYGTTPALTQTFGNQLLANNQQGLGLQGLQNEIMQNIINGQLGRGKLKDNWDRFTDTLTAGGKLAGGIGSLGSLG